MTGYYQNRKFQAANKNCGYTSIGDIKLKAPRVGVRLLCIFLDVSLDKVQPTSLPLASKQRAIISANLLMRDNILPFPNIL